MKIKKTTIWLIILIAGSLVSFFLVQYANYDFDWQEDETTNNAIQPPEEVMNMIGVTEGMIIGEFGSGYGRFTIHLATKVGEKGYIYANDIDESSLSFLKKRCEKAGITNVKTILGKVDDPLFPKESLDMAFSTLVYHEIERPVTFMKNLIPALKPNAAVIIVDNDPQINKEKSNLNRDWNKEFEEAGFEFIKMEKLRERDVIFFLRVKAQVNK